MTAVVAPVPLDPAVVVQVPMIPDRGHYTEDARLRRLEFARHNSAAPLTALQETRLDAARLTGNIENLIGAVEVPVGIAGPLEIRGEYVSGHVYAPFATSEGALVASATRGAIAVSRSGGVRTRVLGQRMTRVPAFAVTSLDGAFTFANLVRDHHDELKAEAGRVSQHARLISVEPVIIGRVVYVYFTYETGDAAGQNMTTSCTWHAAQWLMRTAQPLPDIEIEHFYIESNMSGDKKVGHQSFTTGRGIRVIAECLIDRQTCERLLKTTPEAMALAHQVATASAIHVGMVGYNINIANVIAATFTATGQDIACVHESSLGHLQVQVHSDGLHASMTLPGLVVGTVGGGTHLPAQNALLEMMGCAGTGKAFRLAEIIAGFCLALDLSTLAAVVSGQFVSAHERLGRNRPVRHLRREELDAAFFEPFLRDSMRDRALVAQAVDPLDGVVGSSIITELAAGKTHKLLGLLPLRVHYRGSGVGCEQLDVVVKVKPLDDEVELIASSMASLCGGALATQYPRFRGRTGFAGCHAREIGAYRQTDPRWTRHVPRIHGTIADADREAYVVIMEHLSDVRLKDTADDITDWTAESIEVALRGIAEIHSIWLGRERELAGQRWIGTILTSADLAEMKPLWEALAAHAAAEFPELIDDDIQKRWQTIVATTDQWPTEFERMPRTLIHNDFNPRNICLRPLGPEQRLCAYDWELATLGVPQHDLAELLCFVLNSQTEKSEVNRLIECHRLALEQASGLVLDPVTWRRGYTLSLYDLAINRFGQYLMAHTFRHYGFVDRAVSTLWHLLSLEDDD
ncbi:phosphotransferase [Longispora urticae]